MQIRGKIEMSGIKDNLKKEKILLFIEIYKMKSGKIILFRFVEINLLIR